MSFKPLEVIKKFLDENGYEANFDVKKLAQELTYARNREWRKDQDIWTKSFQEEEAYRKAELEKLRQEQREQLLDVFISIVEAQTYNNPGKYVQKASIKAMNILDIHGNVGVPPK